MKAHLQYLSYVLRHKWFVFLACIDLRVPLHQAIIHDWQKFLPIEWFAYVDEFYSPEHAITRDETGYYHAAGVGGAFDRAWLHHIHLGPHHWQYWILRQDDGEIKALQIPDRFVREMIADWRGAGRAQGTPDTVKWYLKNGEKMALHPETRQRIESLLRIPYADLVEQEQRP